MPKAIKLSDKLVADATKHAKVFHRSPPKQIEYWANIGKTAEDNPDLPLRFVKDILIGLEEADTDEVTDYQFG
ncbi:MAG: hypothetical protein ACI9SC_002339 [Gammaproteobacteria bacterium]|jgi:hypothetical protein